jgi:hypothetical protein
MDVRQRWHFAGLGCGGGPKVVFISKRYQKEAPQPALNTRRVIYDYGMYSREIMRNVLRLDRLHERIFGVSNVFMLQSP